MLIHAKGVVADKTGEVATDRMSKATTLYRQFTLSLLPKKFGYKKKGGMDKRIMAAILGALVGMLGGLQGQAGALYILTGLLAFGIVPSQRMAAGTALLYTSVPITLGAAWQYYSKGDVDLQVAAVIIPVTILFNVLGAKLNYVIPQSVTLYSIALTTLLISGFYFVKARNA